MSPHEHHTKRRSPSSATLAASWDRYLDSRGPRAHGDLLRSVDGHVRAEARRLLGRGHPLFEEVAQEALVGAAQRISTGERPEYPVAYVRKIVNNKVADLLRRETRRRDREQEQWTPEIDLTDASVSAEWHDFLDTLRTIVSNDEFWTLILRYHFDYSYGEIGSLLDKEPNAIRQIAHRGRRKCREHLTRLEGRVPGWVFLPDADPAGDGSAADGAETDAVGDGTGQREPRKPDPADWSRRPSAGSDSDPPAPQTPPAPAPPAALATSAGRHRRRLRPDGVGRPFGNPTTVVPLALVIALPVLVQFDRALDAAVEVSPTLTAEIVDAGIGDDVTPSGPIISVTRSTAPTDQREAPSTSADPSPTGSDPPTTVTSIVDDPASSTSSSEPATTTTTDPTPTSATEPPTTGPSSTGPVTTGPTPTSSSTLPSTTDPPLTTTAAISTSVATTSTTIATTTTTTTSTTTTSPPTTNQTTTIQTTTTTTAATTTTSTTGRPTTTSTTGRPTTNGRDPGDDNPPTDS